jgi:hypothetical protein
MLREDLGPSFLACGVDPDCAAQEACLDEVIAGAEPSPAARVVAAALEGLTLGGARARSLTVFGTTAVVGPAGEAGVGERHAFAGAIGPAHVAIAAFAVEERMRAYALLLRAGAVATGHCDLGRVAGIGSLAATVDVAVLAPPAARYLVEVGLKTFAQEVGIRVRVRVPIRVRVAVPARIRVRVHVRIGATDVDGVSAAAGQENEKAHARSHRRTSARILSRLSVCHYKAR